MSRSYFVLQVETIGDAYLCATNLVWDQTDSHAARMAHFWWELPQWVCLLSFRVHHVCFIFLLRTAASCLKIESSCSNVHGPWSVVCYTYSWFSWIPCAIIHYPSSLPLPLFMTLPLAHALSSVQISFHRQPLLAFNPMWSVWQQCKQPIKQQ